MDSDDLISKTRRKKQMLEIQALGAALTKLSKEQLAHIEMPEELRDAVLDARRFTKHEAHRRQLQYIGRMMRDMDVAPIAEQLAALNAPSHRQTALFHLAEKWRTDLLVDPVAIERFLAEFPGADAQALRKLIETVLKKQRTASTAPKHFRELFHMVNALVQQRGRDSA